MSKDENVRTRFFHGLGKADRGTWLISRDRESNIIIRNCRESRQRSRFKISASLGLAQT